MKSYLTTNNLTDNRDIKLKEELANWKNVDLSSSETEDSGSDYKSNASKVDESEDHNAEQGIDRDENTSNEEHKDDDDFIEEDEVVIFHEDLPQALKGFRLDLIGKPKALGKDEQSELLRRKDKGID